jgi:hypothetical protein
MFGWLKKRDQTPVSDEPMVTVYLYPLVMLLARAEQEKGSPLTEADVLHVRDSAQGAQMTRSMAEKYYSALDAEMAIPRLDPDRLWEEWQKIRPSIRRDG